VVHICSGMAALSCALVMGRRKGYGKDDMKPHNLTMTIIGATLRYALVRIRTGERGDPALI